MFNLTKVIDNSFLFVTIVTHSLDMLIENSKQKEKLNLIHS